LANLCSWIVNALAVAPGKVVMPEGATNRTPDRRRRGGGRRRVALLDHAVAAGEFV